jgi:hypothetical protein
MTVKVNTNLTVQEFIEKLSTLTFDEVTTEQIQILFPNHKGIEVEDDDIDGNMKNITIDDYTFSISSKLPEETSISDININSTIALDKEVSMWMKDAENENGDIDALGTIIKEGNEYYMHVEFDTL